jgi:hypothetical protein
MLENIAQAGLTDPGYYIRRGLWGLTSSQYKDVGTKIDCAAVTLEGGRFKIDLSIEDVSVVRRGSVGRERRQDRRWATKLQEVLVSQHGHHEGWTGDVTVTDKTMLKNGVNNLPRQVSFVLSPPEPVIARFDQSRQRISCHSYARRSNPRCAMRKLSLPRPH